MTKESSNPTFYDADSSTYDEQRWTSSAGARTNRIQQEIVEKLTADWREQRILEIGPGTARFTIPLARRGNKMTIVDISAGMLEQATQNLTAEKLEGQIEQAIEASIYELPFDDSAFDHAICLNVFNHLEHAGQALAQMAKVIKPGSTLLFNYANLRSYYWATARRINARNSAVGQDVYSTWERPGAVKAMIADAGLELVQRTGHVHAPRALQKAKLSGIVPMLDSVSRGGPLSAFAPVHFCLCRRKSAT